MPFPLPAFIQFYPTLRCNQRCSFCFNRGMPEQQDMAFDDAMRMLDLFCQSRVSTIDIMGGEPLLLDWIADFARQAAARGLSVNISTNGSLPGLISAFRGIPADRLRIGVSIEGDEEAHGFLTRTDHFEKAFETLARIREAGLLPMAKTVVSERTLLPIRRLIPRLEEVGVREYFLIHADVMERGQAAAGRSLPFQDFLRFFGQVASEFPALGIGKVHASCFKRSDLPAGVRCAGGVKKLAVMPDGSVYPCNLLAHFADFRLGNIFNEDIETLWQHPVLSPFRTFSGNSCDLRDCANYASCTGGCPAHNVLHSGRFDGRDIRCLAHASAEWHVVRKMSLQEKNPPAPAMRYNEPMSRTCTYTVTEDESGKRIDVAAASLSGISRSQVQRLIEDSRLTVNGRVPRPNEHARSGDLILIEAAEEAPVLLAEPLAVPVLYQDDSVIVVDKPHGMVVYPAAGHDRGTLMNAVSSLCPKLASVGGPLRPGVVHRLDKDTSGVMVVALDDRAYYDLVEQFRSRTILRSYLAIVVGRLRQDRGTIDLAIGRSVSDRKKMSTRTRRGKEASTAWEAVERFPAATLIRARLGTGRTHQIRVHFSAIGHPVLGDRTYGNQVSLEIGRTKVPVARQMLHAELLGFRHPDTGRQMEFRSDLPSDMADLLRQLRSGSAS